MRVSYELCGLDGLRVLDIFAFGEKLTFARRFITAVCKQNAKLAPPRLRMGGLLRA